MKSKAVLLRVVPIVVIAISAAILCIQAACTGGTGGGGYPVGSSRGSY